MKNKYKKNCSGFALSEILAIISIIVIIATIVVYGTFQALNIIRTNKANTELAFIESAINFMRLDTKEWPGHQVVKTVCTNLQGGCPDNNEICSDGCTYNIASGFAGLLQDDATTPYNNWGGPYLETTPTDPWGNEYFIDTDYDIDDPNGEWKAVIGSYGPNGQGNNSYDSDDIIKIIGF
jgi:type II secretory pathway pseudopilin PulG